MISPRNTLMQLPTDIMISSIISIVIFLPCQRADCDSHRILKWHTNNNSIIQQYISNKNCVRTSPGDSMSAILGTLLKKHGCGAHNGPTRSICMSTPAARARAASGPQSRLLRTLHHRGALRVADNGHVIRRLRRRHCFQAGLALLFLPATHQLRVSNG